MISYLLDTSIIIDYLRGKIEVVVLLDNLDGVLNSSVISLAELYEGVFRVDNSEELEKGVVNFFSSLSETYNVDTKIAKLFGQIRAQLKETGEIIEDLDILIGATCIAHNLILITKNKKHFSRIQDLRLY